MSAESASWVIRRKSDGAVIAETFNRHIADAVNFEKYEVMPILQHLQEFNRIVKLSTGEQV